MEKIGVIEEFRKNLANITNQSTSDPFFNVFVSAVGGEYNEPEGKVTINLDLRQAREATSAHIVEEAIRIKIGDAIESRPKDKKRVDVFFNGKEIECKHSLEKHKRAPIDYVGIKKSQDKWYLLSEGPIIGDSTTLSCFFYRSDFYYEMMKKNVEGKNSIDIDSSNALAEIEDEILSLTTDLAQAILHKAKGNQGRSGSRMTLSRLIGLNKVRFDLKFERIIKEYIDLLT